MKNPVDRDKRFQPETAIYPAWHHLRVLNTPFLALMLFGWAPESPWVSVGFFLVSILLDFTAEKSGSEKGKPSNLFASRHFRLLLYILFVLHWIILFLAISFVMEVGLFSAHTPFLLYMLIISGGITGPITGHELAHSRKLHEHWMGRLLYCGFLHDHWWVDHIRSHHTRFGTLDDPSTARLNEKLWQYFLRFFPAQALNAWRLEKSRLRNKSGLKQWLSNTLIHGFLVEIVIIAIVAQMFGAIGLVVFLFQAIALMLVLHTVNYFQHWGLIRSQMNDVCAWDSNNRSGLFSTLGNLRHADHHLNVGRRYYELEYHTNSPKMPYGFGGMFALTLFRPNYFCRVMQAELDRLGLLPHAEDAL